MRDPHAHPRHGEMSYSSAFGSPVHGGHSSKTRNNIKRRSLEEEAGLLTISSVCYGFYLEVLLIVCHWLESLPARTELPTFANVIPQLVLALANHLNQRKLALT